MLITTVCPANCKSCSKTGRDACEECVPGTYLTPSGKCVPCVEHCDTCDESAANYTGSASAAPCDRQGCETGFGLTEGGDCVRCEVASCKICDGNANRTAVVDRCDRCHDHLGIALKANSTQVSCEPCSHPKCLCTEAGRCDNCQVGWGLAIDVNSSAPICTECDEGCTDCVHAGASNCTECKRGYVLNQGVCKVCPPHCSDCSADASERTTCNACRPGYGILRGNAWSSACAKCRVNKCTRCDHDINRCLECDEDYGLTPKNVSCQQCGENCHRCNRAGLCVGCVGGYALDRDRCKPCADSCGSCSNAGPARCDVCLRGFVLDEDTKTCTSRELESDQGSYEV